MTHMLEKVYDLEEMLEKSLVVRFRGKTKKKQKKME